MGNLKIILQSSQISIASTVERIRLNALKRVTQMTDLSHLNALEVRLSHERDYLAAAKTNKERAFREHQISMVEKEIAGEKKFLGIDAASAEIEMSDDELLAELLS